MVLQNTSCITESQEKQTAKKKQLDWTVERSGAQYCWTNTLFLCLLHCLTSLEQSRMSNCYRTPLKALFKAIFLLTYVVQYKQWPLWGIFGSNTESVTYRVLRAFLHFQHTPAGQLLTQWMMGSSGSTWPVITVYLLRNSSRRNGRHRHSNSHSRNDDGRPRVVPSYA